MVVHNIGELTVFIPGHRPESIRFKKPVNLTRPRDDIAVPEEILAPTCTFLEYPPPERIVAIAPATVRAIGHNKLILSVPLKRPALRANPLRATVRRITRPQVSCSSVTTSPRGRE